MIKPLYICPEFGTNDVNARIVEIFIKNLPNIFQPTILCKPNKISTFDKIEICQDEKLMLFEKKYRSYSFSPDTYYYSWAEPARKILEKENNFSYDYIHTVSIPYATHLLGRNFKRKFKKPWVAQFLEPWYMNPYMGIKKNVFYKYAIKRWEEQVANEADIIIHNSEIMCKIWKERYGRVVENRMFVQNMPFDPLLLSRNYKNETGKFVISHIGNLVGLRTAIPFIKAVSQLLDRDPKLRNKLQINFVGKTQINDLNFIKQANLLDVFNVVDSIPEHECENFYNMTDMFLVIEGTNQGGMFYPSKLIKYFYYGKPILGLTTEDSVLWQELVRTNNKCILNKNTTEIVLFLENSITNYKDVCCNDINYWKKFDVKNIVKDYECIIQELLMK